LKDRRILALRCERGGSNYFTGLLFGSQGRYEDGFNALVATRNNDVPRDKKVWLHTIPEKQCKIFTYKKYLGGLQTDEYLENNPIPNGPEFFIKNTGMSQNKSYFDQLPKADWRFIYLLRDPRNHISSWYRRRLNSNRKDVPISCLDGPGDREFWKYRCNLYANTQLKSVSTMLDDERYLLVRFEELIIDPLFQIKTMFLHMGLVPDMEFYESFLKKPVTNTEKLSSYSDEGAGSNERWHEWSDEQKSIFLSYASPVFYEIFGVKKEF